jgi:DNA-binding transcriptional MerR regulator
MNEANLTISEVAKIVRCHRNTILNYEEKGLIRPWRDHNGFRRYSLAEALRLKEIFEIRTREASQ